jgi:hypothetical protein
MNASLTRVVALDRELEARGPVLSLGPGRPRATSLATLVRRHASTGDAALDDETARGVDRIVRAMLQAFPDNVFWDLDLLVVRLVENARTTDCPLDVLREHVDAIIGLQEQFGHATAISFRYVHDFIYGFDWARWVARDPATRAEIGPFDPPFVGVMRRRGEALIDAIDQGSDPKYPPLRDERHRNPFGFSRAPRAEVVLHRHLARCGLIPVEAWRVDAQPKWRDDYTQMRRREAQRLGLTESE